MVKRAIRNCPNGIFLVSDHIPYRGFGIFGHIICYDVIYNLPSIENVAKVIDKMKRVSIEL